MRLTSVILHSSYYSEDLVLGMRETGIHTKYIVRNMVGIDAEELIPKFYGKGLVTGDRYYEHVMKPRDIVIRIALNPKYHINESVSELRNDLYKFISSNRTGRLQLQFKSGASIVAVINGFITKFEVGHFNNLPELQITVTCKDPIFRSFAPVDLAAADIPTSNPITLADSESTAPHGFSFSVEFTAATATFTVQDDPTTPDWKFEVSPDGGFLVNDVLFFSSELNDKRLYLYRPLGTSFHLMDKVAAGSIWPQIFPGDNKFYFLPIANFDWVEINYFYAHWGL